jgi:hypothetical protein
MEVSDNPAALAVETTTTPQTTADKNAGSIFTSLIMLGCRRNVNLGDKISRWTS